MDTTIGRTKEETRIEPAVIRQAAAVVDAAVRASTATAMHAAQRCRCRGCQATAARTLDWAVGMLEAPPSPEPTSRQPMRYAA